MSGSLHALMRPRGGWSNEERAQFVRIERLLGDAGLAVEVEHGVSDEGDPWCVFCSLHTGDVMIHAARIGRRYVFDSMALPYPIEGASFFNCAERFFQEASLPMTPAHQRRGLMVHPSAMLASLFLTVILYAQATSKQHVATAEADADEPSDVPSALLLRLKQIAQAAAEFVTGQDGTTQHHGGAAAQGWGQAIPLGMAAALLAIAHELRLTGLVGDEEIALVPEDDERLIVLRPEAVVEAAMAELEAGALAEAQDPAADPAEHAAASDAAPVPANGEPVDPAFAAEVEQLALSGESGLLNLPNFAALDLPDTPVSNAEAAQVDAAQADGASADFPGKEESEAYFQTAAIELLSVIFNGVGATALSFGEGAAVIDGATGVLGSGSIEDLVVTGSEVVISSGESSAGAGADLPPAAESVVVTFDPVQPPTQSPGTPTEEPFDFADLVLDDLPSSYAGALLGAEDPLDLADASMDEIAARVFEFIAAAGDVKIQTEFGNLVIIDTDILAIDVATDLALETLRFADNSAIILVGHQADIDLLA